MSAIRHLSLDGLVATVRRKNNGTQSDYDLWRSHFAQPASSGAGAGATISPGAVPEPATRDGLLKIASRAMIESRPSAKLTGMQAKLHTFSLSGIDALPVEVEVDLSPGALPKTVLVGLPKQAVKESTHRIERAMVNSGFVRPQDRVVINLAPAELPKSAGSFDLPIAVGILAGELDIEPTPSRLDQLFQELSHCEEDFADVRGQEMAKRAVTIAASGGHNLLMVGPITPPYSSRMSLVSILS